MQLNKINKTDLAYAAGLFDGEGCVFISNQNHPNSYILKVEVNMTDENSIRWLHKTFGGHFNYNKKSNPRQKLQYRWTASGKDMANFIKLTLPFIRLKKERFELAILYYETISISHPCKGGISKETAILRKSIFNRIKKLNHRGCDD